VLQILKPAAKDNCTSLIQLIFGDDGTLPPVAQGLFTTFTIPLSNDPVFDPNLTPRYQHRCGRIINGQPCFHVDVYSGDRFLGSGAIIDEDFVSTSASIFPNLKLANLLSSFLAHSFLNYGYENASSRHAFYCFSSACHFSMVLQTLQIVIPSVRYLLQAFSSS
jgi:hypothetical protein